MREHLGACRVCLLQIMGSEYVNQESFNPRHVMEESTSSTPIFFILFPGYSPSKEVEQYANKVGTQHAACPSLCATRLRVVACSRLMPACSCPQVPLHASCHRLQRP